MPTADQGVRCGDCRLCFPDEEALAHHRWMDHSAADTSASLGAFDLSCARPPGQRLVDHQLTERLAAVLGAVLLVVGLLVIGLEVTRSLSAS